jgi:ABC-type nitrate/sulfonate/bicarbonate transport system substrate-binding protein
MFTRRAFSAMGLMAFAPLARAQTPAPTIKVGTLKMASLTNAWVAKQAGFFERNGLAHLFSWLVAVFCLQHICEYA